MKTEKIYVEFSHNCKSKYISELGFVLVLGQVFVAILVDVISVNTKTIL